MGLGVFSTLWSILRYAGRGSLVSVYWNFVTISTVGYGDVVPVDVPTTICCVVVCAFGSSFTAYLIGTINSLISGASPTEDNVQHKKTCVKAFLSRNAFSKELEDRATAFFAFLEDSRGGLDESKLLQERLSENLSRDVRLFLTCKIVLACEFIVQRHDPGVIRALLDRLESRFYPKATRVLSSRVVPLGVHFIDKGSARVVPARKVSQARASTTSPQPGEAPGSIMLGRGGFFGEESLGIPEFTKDCGPYSVVTVTACEMWFLAKSDYARVLDEFKDQPGLRSNSMSETAQAFGDAGPPSPAGASPTGDGAFRPIKLQVVTTGLESSNAGTLLDGSLSPVLSPMTSPTAAGQVHRGSSESVLAFDGLESLAKQDSSSLESEEKTKVMAASFLWRGAILLVALWNIMIIPFRVAFLEECVIDAVFLIDYLGDLLLIADIVLRLRGARQNNAHEGDYRKSALFYVHIAAVVPLEILTPAIHIRYLGPAQTLAVLRVNKALRAVDVGLFMPFAEGLLQQAGYKAQKDLLHVANLILAMLLTSHWYACVFFLIANMEHHRGSTNNWADAQEILRECSLGHAACGVLPTNQLILAQYCRSIYWSITTLTTVGYGDVVPKSPRELIFAIGVFLSGIVVISFLISGLNEVVTQMDVSSTLFRKRQVMFKQLAEFYRLPSSLRVRGESYMNTLWVNQRGISSRALKQYLPPVLYADVVREMVGHLVGDLFFVSERDPHFVGLLAQRIHLDLYLEGDVLFVEGECADTLFFILDGSVALVSEAADTVYTTLERCAIGEGEFFARALQPCTARAGSASQVACLHFRDFWQLLEELGWVAIFQDCLRRNEKQLQKNSTGHLIAKLKANLKSSKVGKLMDTSASEEASFVVLPDSPYRQLWNLTSLVCLIYYCNIIPWGLGMGFRGLGHSVEVTDLLADLFFALDIVQRAKIFAIEVDGSLIRRPAVFRPIYMKQDFALDAISVVPACFIAYLVPGGRVFYFPLRLLQLVRLRHLFRYTQGVVDSVERLSGLPWPAVLRRGVDMFMAVCTTAHIMACLFLGLGRLEADRGESSWMTTAATAAGVLYIDASARSQYIYALAWSTYTIATVGYGTIPIKSDSERILCMVTMMLGAVLCNAGVAAVFSAAFEESDRQAGANHMRTEAAKKLLQSSVGSEPVKDKVGRYFKYVDTTLRNVDEGETLQWFPTGFKRSYLQHGVLPVLKSAVVFKDTAHGTLVTIANRFKPHVAVPGEVIIQRDQKEQWLHILKKGRAAIIDSSPAADREVVVREALLSNLEARTMAALHGLPSKRLEVTVLGWRGGEGAKAERKSLRAYVELVYSFKRFRTTVKKGKHSIRWNETLTTKAVASPIDVRLNVSNCLHSSDVILGTATLSLAAAGGGDNGDDSGEGEGEGDGEAALDLSSSWRQEPLPVLTSTGVRQGTLDVAWRLLDLPEDAIPRKADCMVVAETYCHLYSVPVETVKEIEAYVERALMPGPVVGRLQSSRSGAPGPGEAPPAFNSQDDPTPTPSLKDRKLSLTIVAEITEVPPVLDEGSDDEKDPKDDLSETVLLSAKMKSRFTAAVLKKKGAPIRESFVEVAQNALLMERSLTGEESERFLGLNSARSVEERVRSFPGMIDIIGGAVTPRRSSNAPTPRSRRSSRVADEATASGSALDG
jgi:CRP-like cAMP-binding protein